MDPVVARQTWRTLEPIHGMIYFVPEAGECYSRIGLKGNRMGYFASRSAAFGPASAEVVISTFYNFCPDLVRRVIPAAWGLASPAEVLAARYEAADLALRRALGGDAVASKELEEASELARTAALAAGTDLYGRPLFAAHAALPWPSLPHMVLWHAETLMREFRGDGHIAALLLADLDPVEALVTHAGTGEVAVDILRATRAWPQADWDAAVQRLEERGLVGPGAEPTASGRELRQGIEEQTDRSALAPYEALGKEGCARLRTLVRPFSQAVVEKGLLSSDPGQFDR